MPSTSSMTAALNVNPRWPTTASDAALSVDTTIGGSVVLLRKPVRDVELIDQLGAMLAAREAAGV